jgi:ATP-binding cassette subfamily F protein uup
METLDVLEDTLGEYPGTVLLISHDRDFLDRLVSSVVAPEGNGHWVEYAGGYNDMLAQRGADLIRQAPKREPQRIAQEAAPVPKSQSPKRRMSFKDKHALDTLPKTIAALRAEADAWQATLDEPQFYARDRAAFEEAATALGSLQKRIAAAEEHWLELEILREELAGADVGGVPAPTAGLAE